MAETRENWDFKVVSDCFYATLDEINNKTRLSYRNKMISYSKDGVAS